MNEIVSNYDNNPPTEFTPDHAVFDARAAYIANNVPKSN